MVCRVWKVILCCGIDVPKLDWTGSRLSGLGFKLRIDVCSRRNLSLAHD